MQRIQRTRIEVLENTRQCHDVVFAFGALERFLQHRADVVGSDPLHLPIGIETLALFYTAVQGDDVVQKGRDAQEASHGGAIIGLLRRAEVELAQGRTVGEICRRLEVLEATFDRWRSEYGGLKVD